MCRCDRNRYRSSENARHSARDVGKAEFCEANGRQVYANAIDVDIGPPKMRDVSHGILEKLNNLRQCRCRASANAINIEIGPPRMRNIQKADFTQEI